MTKRDKNHYTIEFDGLLSLADAAKIWGITDSALRKAITAGRLQQAKDCQKYGKQWVVTVDAMARVFSRIGIPDYTPWVKYLRENHQAEYDDWKGEG